MKVYKERQFLIFDFEDGRMVKYDFAKKETIGIRGKVVNDLRSQLKDFSFNKMIDCIKDKSYGNFLMYVKGEEEKRNGSCITNIGTILDRVPLYSNLEQIFSAGIRVHSGFPNLNINDIPKGLIKLCREHDIKLTGRMIKYYKENPDIYNMAYSLKYTSLTSFKITYVLFNEGSNYVQYSNGRVYYTFFGKLIKNYGYSAKPLMLYIDYLMTYEALEDMNYILRELIDYASMMSGLSDKFEKYPRHFLTTHKIACRNYSRLKHVFDENKFKKAIDLSFECKIDGFDFIYPKSTQEIKDEAVSQSNCVASYVNNVLDGQCHILFMRKSEEPNKSYITLEVRDSTIVQAKRKFNEYISTYEQSIVDIWNKKHKKKEVDANDY